MSTEPPLSLLVAELEEIEDAEDETFQVFSQSIPSSNLGFLDAKTDEVELEISNHTYLLKQNRGVLHSDRAAGTTGAVLWKVTPLVAQWLVDRGNPLWRRGVLNPRAVVVELGCGISGLIGLVLGQHVGRYMLTDQGYVMKTLKQNVEQNSIPARKTGRSASSSIATANLELVSFDWEADKFSIPGDQGAGADLVVACDCIYNDFLVVPFVQACKDVCQQRAQAESQYPTILLIAQQQRSADVFESWMRETLKCFDVWRLPDSCLTPTLKAGTGYLLHIAVLKGHRSAA